MRMATRRAGFSKRRSRRKTSFPLVAVVQKRSKVQSTSQKRFKISERKASSAVAGQATNSVKKARDNTTCVQTQSVRVRSAYAIDYKNVVLLRKLITAEGKILPRRINKLTAKQQRYTSKAIKSARIMGLLPFINKSRSFGV